MPLPARRSKAASRSRSRREAGQGSRPWWRRRTPARAGRGAVCSRQIWASTPASTRCCAPARPPAGASAGAWAGCAHCRPGAVAAPADAPLRAGRTGSHRRRSWQSCAAAARPVRAPAGQACGFCSLPQAGTPAAAPPWPAARRAAAPRRPGAAPEQAWLVVDQQQLAIVSVQQHGVSFRVITGFQAFHGVTMPGPGHYNGEMRSLILTFALAITCMRCLRGRARHPPPTRWANC